MPNFRLLQGSFMQAYRGKLSETDVAGGEKAVQDDLERGFRHALSKGGLL
ncbi:hypothetical protein [Paenibacillus tundrae]